MSADDLRAAYRRQRQADFDRAADELGGRVLDPLLAKIKRPILPYPLGSDSYAAWLSERGPEAGLALVAETRRLLGGLEARPPRDELRAANDALSDYTSAFAGRVEMPWVVIELLRSGPSAIDLVRYSGLRAIANLEERGRAALRSGVRHRHRFALDLGRYLGRAYDVELAFHTIEVPALRELAAAALHARASELLPQLRDLEARSRNGDPELHAVALRLLRAGDKDVMADGRRATTPLEKIEADLRRDPTDEEASQVWADALAGAGDPRGNYVLLEHAMRAEKDPARLLALSAEQAALLPAVLGKPGGFPFSEAFTGRRTVTLRPSLPVHVPELRPGNAFDRAQALVTEFGDVEGPTEIHFHEYRERATTDPDRVVSASSDMEAEFLRLLAPARLIRNRYRRTYVVREDRRSPLADPAALRELVRSTGGLTLVYRFLHTHPGTGIRLPYQERGRIKLSRLQVAPRLREETLYDFHFPFQTIDDPGLVARCRAMRETYGHFPDQGV